MELLIGLAIVGILMKVSSSLYTEHVKKTKIYEASHFISIVGGSIQGFIEDTGRAPDDLAQVGYYGDSLIDPWGFEYRYNANMNQKGKGGIRKDRSLNPLNTDFDLYSVGEDGATSQSLMAKASDDDVIRAFNGKYIGLAEDF